MATDLKNNAVNTTSDVTKNGEAAPVVKSPWTLVHKGGTSWLLNGKVATPAEAMQAMKVKGIAIPVWLEREVRTGKTLEQRRAAKAESAARRSAEKSGNWTL